MRVAPARGETLSFKPKVWQQVEHISLTCRSALARDSFLSVTRLRLTPRDRGQARSYKD
jgi:hypothetical protein